jgi:hypothetical protein
MTLIERLLELTTIWSAASGKSPATLSTRVVNDGKFFARIEQSRTCSVASWEQFLGFFRDSANWPNDTIPPDAAELLGDLDAIALPARPSSGNGDDISGSAAKALAITADVARSIA